MNIHVSKETLLEEPIRVCPGCGCQIFDRRATYCSIRCRKSSEFGRLTSQQKHEIEILMQQYRAGGFE